MARALAQRRKPPKAAATGARALPARALQLPELDRLIHERIRLGIVSALATNASLSFNDLKRILKTTDGNLSVHARKLEEAEYISCLKYFEGRVPRTEYRLTANRPPRPGPLPRIKWRNGSAAPETSKMRSCGADTPARCLILDLAFEVMDSTAACSTVEERRFSAA